MDAEIEKKLLEDVKIEDLSEEVQVIASMIGFENLMKLSHYANGSLIYIPIPERILRKARNREIKREYTGENMKELAKKWGITEEQIKRILRDYNPKQLSIFDVFASDGKLKE